MLIAALLLILAFLVMALFSQWLGFFPAGSEFYTVGIALVIIIVGAGVYYALQ